MNLLNLDIQALGIPDTEYPTYIKMSSGEFVSLCKDFTQLSDSLKIEVKDKKATFSINGKAGVGKIIMKNNNAEKIRANFLLYFEVKSISAFLKNSSSKINSTS